MCLSSLTKCCPQKGPLQCSQVSRRIVPEFPGLLYRWSEGPARGPRKQRFPTEGNVSPTALVGIAGTVHILREGGGNFLSASSRHSGGA